MSYLTISTLRIGSKIIIRLRVPWNRLYNRSLTHSWNHFSVNWIIASSYSQIIFQFSMSVWVHWWILASLDIKVAAFVTYNRVRIAFCTNSENLLISWTISILNHRIFFRKFRIFDQIYHVNKKKNSSSIPFLIPKDSTIRFLSISIMLAARIFAKVGMQSYSITVFVSGDKYSEIGLCVIWRGLWIWKR